VQSRSPYHIAIEGTIGVGKTSLTIRIAADFNAKILLEAPEKIPFSIIFMSICGKIPACAVVFSDAAG
jgi:deoxyadenosine/deoxycytidine kinase